MSSFPERALGQAFLESQMAVTGAAHPIYSCTSFFQTPPLFSPTTTTTLHPLLASPTQKLAVSDAQRKKESTCLKQHVRSKSGTGQPLLPLHAYFTVF